MVSDAKAAEDRASVLKNALSPTRVCMRATLHQVIVPIILLSVIATSAWAGGHASAGGAEGCEAIKENSDVKA